MDEQSEIAEGAKAHPQVVAEFGEYNDPQVQAYFSALGKRLATVSQRPQLEWHFTVLDSPGHQRVCAAGRLRLRHARNHGVHGQRSGPRGRHRPRDRPRHGAARFTTRDTPASRGNRCDGGDDPRRRARNRRCPRRSTGRVAGVAGYCGRIHREVQPCAGIAGGSARRRIPRRRQLRSAQHGRRDQGARKPGTFCRRPGARRRPHAAIRVGLARIAPDQRGAPARHHADRGRVRGEDGLRRRRPRRVSAR